MTESRGPEGAEWSRRGFLSALGTGSIVALTHDSMHRASSISEALVPLGSRAARDDEYLFASDLAYFATASANGRLHHGRITSL